MVRGGGHYESGEVTSDAYSVIVKYLSLCIVMTSPVRFFVFFASVGAGRTRNGADRNNQKTP